MGMQTDVKAAANTASATFFAGPARVKGIVVTSGAAAGTLIVRDGGSSGTVRLTINTPAAAGIQNVLIPGEGVRFDTDIYVALTNVTAATVFYG
jgi:hypothetical protein